MNLDIKSTAPLTIKQRAMRDAIQAVAVGLNRGRDIPRNHAKLLMEGILSGDIDEVQTAVFFIALRMKRESMSEFLGLFDALLDPVVPVTASIDNVIVLADPFDGYVRNLTMTPFIPAVLSVFGLHSVMHGVETLGPKHGITAHKVYKLAGIDTTHGPETVAHNLADSGWGYVDQSRYAPDLFALQNLRDRMVKRTALTTLERLLVPIRGRLNTNLVLGYVHKAYPEIYATVAREAGYQRVLLLKGVEGGVAPALNKPVRRYFFEEELPSDISAEKELIESQHLFNATSAAQVINDSNKTVEQCLEVGLNVLNGAKNTCTSIARDSLCLATAQILTAYQTNLSLSGAVEKVQACLDNGSAKERFNSAG